MKKLSIFFFNKFLLLNFLLKRNAFEKQETALILNDFADLLILPYGQVSYTKTHFCVSYFLFFEVWTVNEIYLFFFSRSHLFQFTSYANIVLLNNFDKKVLFNSFLPKSLLPQVNINLNNVLNKAHLLTIISKFNVKFNFNEVIFLQIYKKMCMSNFFFKNEIFVTLLDSYLLLKAIFIEYKKINLFCTNRCFIDTTNFYGSSSVILNYDTSFFMNSLKPLSKNSELLKFKFPFLLHFLRVQRRYNKRRYAKSRLYSRPSFFAGVCLSSVIISSFWGGTIKSVDWLSVLPVVININYILYTILFIIFFKFVQLMYNVIFWNNSNKFKTYYFLNIIFFKRFFKKII